MRAYTLTNTELMLASYYSLMILCVVMRVEEIGYENSVNLLNVWHFIYYMRLLYVCVCALVFVLCVCAYRYLIIKLFVFKNLVKNNTKFILMQIYNVDRYI